jgi:hypothetical protein
MQGQWVSSVIATGTTTDEIDLGMECTGVLIVLAAEAAGATWTIAVSPDRDTWTVLDKADAGGALAIPEKKASFVDCLGGVQYIKLISAGSETAYTVYCKGVA